MKIASAYIEINNQCNLDCHTCYNRSGKNFQRQELSIAQFQKITERLISEFGCKSISLAGGEPTLHLSFGEILDYLYSIPDMQVGVVTNGTTGCQKLIEMYCSHPDMKLQVSLDGSCEESNARTRGNGHFQQAIKFLKVAAAPNRSPIMKMVISLNNITDIENYYRLAVSMGCMPAFSFINGIGNAQDGWDTLQPSAQQKLAVLHLLDRLNNEHQMDVKIPVSTSSCPFIKEDAPLSVLIKCNGTMLPCQILYDDAYSLGNLLVDPMNIFTIRYAALSRLANDRIEENDECSRCIMQHTCKRGCLAHAVAFNGDPLGNDGECEFRKLQLLCYEVPK